MSFPTKDSLCTRFATELVLRRDITPGIKISIIPGPDRSSDEIQKLSKFKVETKMDQLELEDVVEQAKDAMGLSDSKAFSTDTLRVELYGPDQPHLTMVDLPGLFQVGNSKQSLEDASTVRKMVRGYMRRRRSIILAVVSAKSDFALQEVTQIARELDPNGTRTLGLITKPDTLDAGSDSEISYVKLAQNKDVVFRLGWHVLKNRSYDMRNANTAERDEAEEKFFATGVWATLDPGILGVKSLKPRLSNVLKDQILRQLPSLLVEVETGILDCQDRLDRLGAPRTTFEEQRRYLLHVSQEFSALMRAAVQGNYNERFFGNAKLDIEYHKRLRAVVQNTLISFGQEMAYEGQARMIVESPTKEQRLEDTVVSRADYVDEVIELMRRSRGCELRGTFNPLIIGELFTEQCQPWKSITEVAEKDILNAVYSTTQAILDHVAVGETADGIFRIINAKIDVLKGDLHGKIVELLHPHYNGHPITYNHYLTDTVQSVQSERRRRSNEEAFKKVLTFSSLDSPQSINPMKLLNALQERVDTDMERYAGESAVDYMQAYYKVRHQTNANDSC
jgi:hypothetical protein